MFGARFADNADDDKIFASFETEPGIFNDKLMRPMLVNDLITVRYRDVKSFNHGVMGGIQ